MGRGQTGTRSIVLTLLAFTMPAILPGQTPPAETETPPSLRTILDASFAGDLWDDGLAEVATYEASRIIHGEARPHTVRVVTMAEDFNTEFYAKADWPYHQKPIKPVMRQSYLAEIPDGNEELRLMSSTFVARNDFGECVKVTISSQELDGMTFKEFRFWEDRPREVYHSYWDGEGSGERVLGSDIDDYLEEELPLALRALPFRTGLVASFWLYPNQMTTRAPEPRPVAARLVVKDGNKGWQVVVETRDERRIQYEFSRDYPHVLLGYEHSDGRTLSLTSAERTAYWISGD